MKRLDFISLAVIDRDDAHTWETFHVTGTDIHRAFANALYWMKTRGFTPRDHDWRLSAHVKDVDEVEAPPPMELTRWRSFRNAFGGAV